MRKSDSLIPLKSLIFNFHATNTIMISFLPLYLQYKDLTGTEIGWVLAIGPFASIISQPFWGYLSDKFKTVKWMLVSSIICMLIMSVIFFQMNALLPILIFAAIFYFFSSPVGALSDSLAQRRAIDLKVSFGGIRMWGSLGFAFSSLVVGGILSRVGIQFLMCPYVVLGLTLLAISFLIKDVKTDATPVQFSDIGILLKNKPFLIFLSFLMFVTMTHRANDSFVGIFITELGGSADLVGTAWFIAVLSEAVVFASAGFWFRKYHPVVFVIIAGVIYTIRWFLYGIATSPAHIILLQVLHGFTFASLYVAAFAYVTRIIPETLQSTGHLIFYSVMFGLSGIIGSMGGGFIIENYGGHTLYGSMSVVSFIGVLLLSVYYVRIRRAELS